MAHVTIYTRPGCGYCMRALSVLEEKGADFNEVHAGSDPAKREDVKKAVEDQIDAEVQAVAEVAASAVGRGLCARFLELSDRSVRA